MVACCYTKCQRIRKRRSEAVVVEISSAESFGSTSQFLTHGGSPDTFVTTKDSIQKEDRRYCRSLLLRSAFSTGSHVGRGYQLLGVWSNARSESQAGWKLGPDQNPWWIQDVDTQAISCTLLSLWPVCWPHPSLCNQKDANCCTKENQKVAEPTKKLNCFRSLPPEPDWHTRTNGI